MVGKMNGQGYLDGVSGLLHDKKGAKQQDRKSVPNVDQAVLLAVLHRLIFRNR